jgi:hypothetical protein
MDLDYDQLREVKQRFFDIGGSLRLLPPQKLVAMI